MKWLLVLFPLILMAPPIARAETRVQGQSDPGALCRQAVGVAEGVYSIPRHLLAAIARVESSRRDPVSGGVNPWPWTINFDGQGSFYDNKAQAVSAARSMRPRVSRSIDVGCMQISLVHHPDAFVSLEQAFDPASNAEYGARFLVQLYGKTGSWQKAVALYHSATPELGQEYQRKVYASLPEEERLAGIGSAPAPHAAAGVISGAQSGGFNARSYVLAARTLPPDSSGRGGGSPAVGRNLDSYRAAPVRLARQPKTVAPAMRLQQPR